MPIPYHEMLTLLQTSVKPLHVKTSLPLFEALGRINAAPIYAHFELPRSAISLRDGYAFELQNNSKIPLSQTTLVSTGDALLESMNAVISTEEAAIEENNLIVPLHVNSGCHIKKKGEDIALQECLVKAHEPLSAYKLTALAAQGITHVEVLDKPKVAIVSIGSHLVSLGEVLPSNALYNSNAISLGARILDLGGDVCAIETIVDDETLILESLNRLKQSVDIIITTGALSHNDGIASLIERGMFETLFREVAITPAKPSALSRLGNAWMLHLPGLPLGSLLGFELIGVPLLRVLMGQDNPLPRSYSQINQIALKCRPSCVSVIPGFSDGTTFSCAPHYEAGRLNVLSQCNGYIRVENKESVLQGEKVEFVPF